MAVVLTVARICLDVWRVTPTLQSKDPVAATLRAVVVSAGARKISGNAIRPQSRTSVRNPKLSVERRVQEAALSPPSFVRGNRWPGPLLLVGGQSSPQVAPRVSSVSSCLSVIVNVSSPSQKHSLSTSFIHTRNDDDDDETLLLPFLYLTRG